MFYRNLQVLPLPLKREIVQRQTRRRCNILSDMPAVPMARASQDLQAPEAAALALPLLQAVLDGDPLVDALRPLATRLGASSHSIQSVRYRDGRVVGCVVDGHGGCGPDAWADYANLWVRRCPRAQALRHVPPGVRDMAELVPAEAWRASRVWTEWGRPNGAAFHALAATLRSEGDAMDGIFFQRQADERPFGVQERRLLDALFADLGRAFALQARLAAARAGPEEAAQRGLDAMQDGIALLDADRGLVFANAALCRMAAKGEGFTLGPDGLAVPDPARRAALSRAVTAALAAAEGRIGLLESAGVVALPRSSGRAPFMLRAVPVVSGRVGGGFRGAMLVVADGARRPRPNPALLGRMFGLTPAEAALAGAIATGQTLAVHAKRRGISVETARSHMAAIRRKTGCHRQADLTALLARLPG